MSFWSITDWDWTMVLGFTVYFCAGLALGRIYFHVLWRSTEMIVANGRMWMILVLTIGRLALIVGALIAVSLQGAAPLLATALGIGLARSWTLRVTSEEAP